MRHLLLCSILTACACESTQPCPDVAQEHAEDKVTERVANDLLVAIESAAITQEPVGVSMLDLEILMGPGHREHASLVDGQAMSRVRWENTDGSGIRVHFVGDVPSEFEVIGTLPPGKTAE